MRKTPVFLAALFLFPACGQEPKTHSNRMLILTTEKLLFVASEYAAYRESGDFDVEISTTADLSISTTLQDAVKERVETFYRQAPPEQQQFVLFIADAHFNDLENTQFIPATQGPESGWGDTPYVDFDGDAIPEIPIGRSPFRQSGEVQMYLDRVMDYEANRPIGEWNKAVYMFAGAGGFGPEIDGILEMVGEWVFDEMSYDFDLSMTYASSTSDYYLPHTQWDQEYSQRYQEGAVLIPYIGHTLDQVTCCEQAAPTRRGLVTFFSCGDGAYPYDTGTNPYFSLAEKVLLRTHGPMGSLAAITDSHPYGNAILPRELGHAVIDLHEPTYGQAVTKAKYNMVHRIDSLRETIDAAAKTFTDEDLGHLITTHMTMYNLLGDPAVPLHLPEGRIRFDSPDSVTRGETVTVEGRVWADATRAPMKDGEILVTLEVQRSAVINELIPRDPDNHDPATCMNNHQLANDKIAASATATVENETFTVELTVPPDLPLSAEYYLKGYAHNATGDAMGSHNVVMK
jgi:hypothetical protein